MFENEIELEDETFDTIAQKRARSRKNYVSIPTLDDLQNEEEQWLDSFTHEL